MSLVIKDSTFFGNSDFVKYNTERLIVRSFKATDLHDIFNIYNNEDTCKYLLHNKWTLEDLQEAFNKKLANRFLSQKSMLSLVVV